MSCRYFSTTGVAAVGGGLHMRGTVQATISSKQHEAQKLAVKGKYTPIFADSTAVQIQEPVVENVRYLQCNLIFL